MIKIRMKLKTMLILDILFTLVAYTLTFIVDWRLGIELLFYDAACGIEMKREEYVNKKGKCDAEGR